jgi:putative ABC transport system ATP-binding protein
VSGTQVSMQGVSRKFHLGSEDVWALKDVSLEVAPGEFLALVGRSGSGKTTLLNIIAGLDQPTEGDVLIDGHSVASMSEKELLTLRRRMLGFVFQSFGLLPLLSAEENVELPLRIAGIGFRDRGKRVRHVLDMVGLGKRADHRPYELSGGEQQRVAIARALAIQPTLILADEPTGELDSSTAMQIFTLLRDVSRSEGMTIITSTHDRLVIELADRVEELVNGRHVEHSTLQKLVTERERSPFAAPMPADSESGRTAVPRPTYSPSATPANIAAFSRPPAPPAEPTARADTTESGGGDRPVPVDTHAPSPTVAAEPRPPAPTRDARTSASDAASFARPTGEPHDIPATHAEQAAGTAHTPAGEWARPSERRDAQAPSPPTPEPKAAEPVDDRDDDILRWAPPGRR